MDRGVRGSNPAAAAYLDLFFRLQTFREASFIDPYRTSPMGGIVYRPKPTAGRVVFGEQRKMGMTENDGKTYALSLLTVSEEEHLKIDLKVAALIVYYPFIT